MEFDLENPFTSLDEKQSDTLLDLLASESDHMPSHNFFIHCLKINDFYVSFRQDAVSLILQTQFSCNFEPFISYLAITYLDRFISRQEIPQGKPWVLRLLVVSCICLAAKMKNIHFPLTKFQTEEGLIFDTQMIHRMELLILDSLNWRMRSITPFSFLHFFISQFEPKDPPLTKALKNRATDIIFKAHNEVRLLEFKPSVIAASAVLLSSHELFPFQFPTLKTSISCCEYVNKESLLQCFDTMQEMVKKKDYESILDTIPSSRTPFSVLDYKGTESETEQITSSSISTTNVMPEKREIKRRKMNGFCSESKFQVSRIHHY